MLKDYLGLPSEIQGLGKIYPVKILEFERFRMLAEKYILLSNKYKEVVYEMEIKETQFEALMVGLMQFEIAYEQKNLEEYGQEVQQFYEDLLNMDIRCQMSFDEFIEMLEIVLRTKVKVDKENMCFRTEYGELNDDNFDLFREEVLRQNMLFEPLYYEDWMTQMLLDEWRELSAEKGEESDIDIESMAQLVAVIKGVNPSELVEYTYYQLIADYSRFQMKENYEQVKLIMASGMLEKKIDIPNPASKVGGDDGQHPEEKAFLGGSGFDRGIDEALGVNEG